MNEEPSQPLNFISARTAAQRIDVKVDTIRRWAKKGQLRSVLLHGRYRISEADLMALIQNAASGARGTAA